MAAEGRLHELAICRTQNGPGGDLDQFGCGPVAVTRRRLSAVEITDAQAALDALNAQIATNADLTEDGLARWFARAWPDYRRVARWGQWLKFDGRRWSEDATMNVFSDIRDFLRVRATHETDNDAQRTRLRSAQAVAAVERLAQSDRGYAATVDQWDTDPWLLNTPGGILDLRTGVLRAHDRDAYMTKLTAVTPTGDCPNWLSFLKDVTAGDTDLMAFMQRMAGYCLTGSTQEHALFFLYGTGGNGKSVFLNTLANALGDYARVAPMEAFTETTGERHPTDLAMLQGARLAVAQETDEGRRWAEARIKALTGGDPITARFMRQDFFTYQPSFKLVIAGNHKPRISAVDEAMRRRLYLVPFTVTIPPERRILGLAETMRAEWPGILNWVVAGCLDWQAQGLAAPESVRAATDDYFVNQDTFADWLTEKCETGLTCWEVPTRLYRSWAAFAEAGRERPGRKAEFADRLAARGFKAGNDSAHGGRYWSGLKLRDAGNPDDWSAAP